jgi:hypothetical protein
MKYLLQWGICLLTIGLVLIMAGCYKKGDKIESPANFIPAGINEENVTYNNYVHEVIKNNCSTCHGKYGSAAQFWYNTNTYDNAVKYGLRMVETIEEGSMPPIPRKPFSDEDKHLLRAWIDKGLPE